jgi:hypothetical protein
MKRILILYLYFSEVFRVLVPSLTSKVDRIPIVMYEHLEYSEVL